MPTIRLLAIATLAAAAAAPAAAPASAAPASTISPAHVRFPHAAVNARGATVVAWEHLTKGSFAIEARGHLAEKARAHVPALPQGIRRRGRHRDRRHRRGDVA